MDWATFPAIIYFLFGFLASAAAVGSTTANTTATPPTEYVGGQWYLVPDGQSCDYMEAACIRACTSPTDYQFQCLSSPVLVRNMYSCRCTATTVNNGTYLDLGDGNIPNPTVPVPDPSNVKTSYLVLLEDTVSPSSCKTLASYECGLQYTAGRYGEFQIIRQYQYLFEISLSDLFFIMGANFADTTLYLDPTGEPSGATCPVGTGVLESKKKK